MVEEGSLDVEPDAAVARGERIVRSRAERRHRPLLDRRLDRAGNDLGLRPLLLGEVLDEVGLDDRPVLGADRRLMRNWYRRWLPRERHSRVSAGGLDLNYVSEKES